MKPKYISYKGEVLKTMEKQIFAGLNAVGMFVGTEAQLRAAVDTGNLRDSIVYELDEGTLTVVVGTNVDYAYYVEHGTINMLAQPFLNPAIEENIYRIQVLFARAVSF